MRTMDHSGPRDVGLDRGFDVACSFECGWRPPSLRGREGSSGESARRSERGGAGNGSGDHRDLLPPEAGAPGVPRAERL